MRIDNVCAEGCTAAWCPPEDDGGSPVQYYIVERVQVNFHIIHDFWIFTFICRKIVQGRSLVSICAG